MACVPMDKQRILPMQNNKLAMKKLLWILPFALAASLCAAPKTNPSGADTNAPAREK